MLFKGIASRVEVKAVRDIYYLEFEAVSLTQMLDVKLKSRFFQNENLTYEALTKPVIDEYKGDIQAKVRKSQNRLESLKHFEQNYVQLKVGEKLLFGLIEE